MVTYNDLADIGLTKGEIKVYLALISIGSTTVGPIINQSGVSSSKVYLILHRLIQKGLASSVIKEKTKYFQAQDPSKIIDYVEKLEQELTTKKKNIIKIMPSLIASMKEKKEVTVEVLEGKNGFMSIHEKELANMSKGEIHYSIADYTFGKEYAAFWVKFNQTRGEKGIQSYLIYSYDNWNQKQRMSVRRKRKLFFPRVLPKNINIPTHISLFKDTVIISIFEKKEIISLVIRNTSFFNAQKQYFDILWNIAQPVNVK